MPTNLQPGAISLSVQFIFEDGEEVNADNIFGDYLMTFALEWTARWYDNTVSGRHPFSAIRFSLTEPGDFEKKLEASVGDEIVNILSPDVVRAMSSKVNLTAEQIESSGVDIDIESVRVYDVRLNSVG